MRFIRTASAGISNWRGDPDCQAAHDEILSHLRNRSANFVPEGETIGNRRRGNLGEHIAFRIGDASDYRNLDRQIKNAADPFSNISSSGIDITWFLISTTSAADDLIAIQETKTTVNSDLGLAYDLTPDYRKLFSLDPRFTLATRLSALTTFLEYERAYDKSILHRVTAMGAATAQLASKVRLVPTLVHEKGMDATPKLLSIKKTISGFGWSENNIFPWSIALSDLAVRLEKIAHGEN